MSLCVAQLNPRGPMKEITFVYTSVSHENLTCYFRNFSKTFDFGKTFFEVLKYRVLLLKCAEAISIAINISLTKAEKLNCGSNYSKSVL